MANKYPEELIEYIRIQSPKVHRKELVEMIGDKFGIHLTIDKLRWICRTKGIKGNPNFKKGVCPHKNTKYKIGDEVFLAGEWRVITSTEEGIPILKRSEYKKRVLWEREHGCIPENHCFIYLDGDRKNCTLDNLACVPIMWMRIINQNGWVTGNKDVTLAAIQWCELHYKLSKKCGNRYVKMDGRRYR